MSIKGKLIGGTLGFMLGGPFASIIGVAIGHTFDRDKDKRAAGGYQYDTQQQTRSFNLDQAQMTFFVATFSMLGKMANADGAVSETERNIVIRFMAEDLHLSRQDQDFAMRIFVFLTR